MAKDYKASDSKAKQSESQEKAPNEAEILNAVSSLAESASQISDLSQKEKDYSSEIGEKIKEMASFFKATYHINPDSVSKTDSMISDAVLTPTGDVCVTLNSGEVISRPIGSLPAETLIKILGDVVPDMQALANEKKNDLLNRAKASGLEALSKEMRKVAVIANSRR